MEVRKIHSEDLSGVVDVYARVFTLPPYSETGEDVTEFSERLSRHTKYRGFLGYEISVGGRVSGFAYGFEYFDGGMTDSVLRSALSEPQRIYWTQDCFEFVELAVLPEMRGRGVGRLLYNRIFERKQKRTALLFTLEEDTVASSMYQKRGWRTIVDGIASEGIPHRMRLMGLKNEGIT